MFDTLFIVNFMLKMGCLIYSIFFVKVVFETDRALDLLIILLVKLSIGWHDFRDGLQPGQPLIYVADKMSFLAYIPVWLIIVTAIVSVLVIPFAAVMAWAQGGDSSDIIIGFIIFTIAISILPSSLSGHPNIRFAAISILVSFFIGNIIGWIGARREKARNEKE